MALVNGLSVAWGPQSTSDGLADSTRDAPARALGRANLTLRRQLRAASRLGIEYPAVFVKGGGRGWRTKVGAPVISITIPRLTRKSQQQLHARMPIASPGISSREITTDPYDVGVRRKAKPA